MSSKDQKTTWYVPHGLVEHPNQPDKPRLVFDARSKFNNICLNDALHNGPLLMTDMLEVLFFFREKPHAVSMDINKMFLQVRVRPEDKTVFRFFWRRPGDPGPPIAHQMSVLIFGASSSPTCAAYVLRHIVEDHPEYADVAELITKKVYVDNYLDSFNTIEQGKATCRRLRELLFLGGFVLGQRDPSVATSHRALQSGSQHRPRRPSGYSNLRTGMEWRRRPFLLHPRHTDVGHEKTSPVRRIRDLRPVGISGGSYNNCQGIAAICMACRS
jgi:hypothetical protein